MNATRKAAAQIGVTFGRDEVEILARLDSYCELTGATRSGAIKRMVRATLEGDDETLRQMRSFIEPVATSGRNLASA